VIQHRPRDRWTALTTARPSPAHHDKPGGSECDAGFSAGWVAMYSIFAASFERQAAAIPLDLLSSQPISDLTTLYIE
jgi:hypothetical protein